MNMQLCECTEYIILAPYAIYLAHNAHYYVRSIGERSKGRRFYNSSSWYSSSQYSIIVRADIRIKMENCGEMENSFHILNLLQSASQKETINKSRFLYHEFLKVFSPCFRSVFGKYSGTSSINDRQNCEHYNCTCVNSRM